MKVTPCLLLLQVTLYPDAFDDHNEGWLAFDILPVNLQDGDFVKISNIPDTFVLRALEIFATRSEYHSVLLFGCWAYLVVSFILGEALPRIIIV